MSWLNSVWQAESAENPLLVDSIFPVWYGKNVQLEQTGVSIVMKNHRLAWMDGMRGLAILWIVFVHFVTIFTPNETADFPGLLGLVLFGISGKLAVAGCSVIMGYFASKPVSADKKIWKYSLRRYLSFVVHILLIEGAYLLLTRIPALNGYALRCVPELRQPLSQLLPVYLADAFLFKAQLIPTFWCVASFVLGSILAFALAKLSGNLPLWLRSLICAGVIAALIWLDCTWLAIALMGWALRLLLEWEIPFRRHALFGLALLAFVPWMIRRGECPQTYLLDGAAAVLVLYVFAQWNWVQKLLSFRPLSGLGVITLELFMLHVPLFEVLRHLINDLCDLALTVPQYGLMFAAVMAVVIPAALLWKQLMKRILPTRS